MGTRKINKRKEKSEEIVREFVPSERENDGNFKQSCLSVQEPKDKEGRSSEGGHRQQ